MRSGESVRGKDLSFPTTPEIMRDADLLFSRHGENKQTGGSARRCLILGILQRYEINIVRKEMYLRTRDKQYHTVSAGLL